MSWPTKDNGGAIHLPAMTIEGEELRRITDAVVASVYVDEDADQLEQLREERLRLNVMIGSQPNLALENLLAERRRG